LRFDRVFSAGEDGDTVPALLAIPEGAVANVTDCRLRKPVLRRLQLLQADNRRGGLFKPSQKDRQPPVHTVDVVGGNLHAWQLRQNVVGILVTSGRIDAPVLLTRLTGIAAPEAAMQTRPAPVR
jgi:hypothetical protein